MVPEGLTALREVSKLSVEVSELLRHPGATKRLTVTEEIPGLGLEMGRVRTELAFELVLESLVDGVLVTGDVRGVFELSCSRCLTQIERPFDVELDELLAYEGQAGNEEGYRIQGDHALLEPIVRDAVMLAMPLNPLCREDCKGLCPVCGADRNVTDCGHRAERSDLRWEPLSELRRQLKE
jgi:uncharacterized protein